MHNFLLFNPTGHSIPADAVRTVFESVSGFDSVRRDTPIGTQVEAHFKDGDDFATARLSKGGERISLSGTSDAALRAALIL